MSPSEAIHVFVCGPQLLGEHLSHLVVRDGTVLWEAREGADPAPKPVEPILAVRHVPIEGFDRLVVLVTEVGLYLTTIDDLTAQGTGQVGQEAFAVGTCQANVLPALSEADSV
jgi:hypothetical protein